MTERNFLEPHHPHGFIPWSGGANPVPGRKVKVIYRGSNVPASPVYDADKVDWAFRSSGPSVVAYAVWSPAP